MVKRRNGNEQDYDLLKENGEWSPPMKTAPTFFFDYNGTLVDNEAGLSEDETAAIVAELRTCGYLVYIICGDPSSVTKPWHSRVGAVLQKSLSYIDRHAMSRYIFIDDDPVWLKACAHAGARRVIRARDIKTVLEV